MKRYTIIFLIFVLVTVLFAGKVNDQFEKRNYSWKSSSTEFVGNNGRDSRSVPNLIDYQGRITDSNDIPITSSVSITFAIYDDASGGSNLWGETHTSVTPADGLVHVLLGSQTTFGASLFDGSDLWLGINVNSDGEMTPRLRIVSVPYAIYAQTAETDNDWTISGNDLYTENSGSVGIGTTTPGYKLDVNGNINISIGSSYMLGGYNMLSGIGSYNTFLGYRAGGTTGDDSGYNVLLGYQAGWNCIGGNNVFLGYKAGYQEVGSNKLYIANSWDTSPLIYGEFDNDMIVINGEFQTTGITRDSGGDAGVSGQVLSSTMTGTNWVDSSNGATEINDLTDAKTDTTSVFLGSDAGINDDGSDNHNVSIGVQALEANTTGPLNTATGYKALRSNDEGYGNCAYGYEALLHNTTGGYNVGIGVLANEHNETGSMNVMIGYMAGIGEPGHNRSGNVCIGFQAGYLPTGSNKLYIENSNDPSPLIYGEFDNDYVKINGDFQIRNELRDSDNQPGTHGQVLSSTGDGTDWVDNFGATEIDELTDGKTGGHSVFLGLNSGINDDGLISYNTGIGEDALTAINTGSYNSSMGYRSLYSIQTGGSNCAFGYKSLYSTTNSGNNAFGAMALEKNTTGTFNQSFGYGALWSNTSGEDNIGIGYYANFYNQTGSQNTIVGNLAGHGNSNHNKSGNVFLGYRAGHNTTGSYNLFLGYDAGYWETGSNKLYIENSWSSTPLIYGDFTDDSEFVKINGDFETTGTATIGDVLHLTPMSSPPSSPSEGDIYVDSDDDHIYCYLNSSWKQLDN